MNKLTRTLTYLRYKAKQIFFFLHVLNGNVCLLVSVSICLKLCVKLGCKKAVKDKRRWQQRASSSRKPSRLTLKHFGMICRILQSFFVQR